jgi:hypothetical protein
MVLQEGDVEDVVDVSLRRKMQAISNGTNPFDDLVGPEVARPEIGGG